MIKLNKLKRKLQGSNDFVGPRTTVKKQNIKEEKRQQQVHKTKRNGKYNTYHGPLFQE